MTARYKLIHGSRRTSKSPMKKDILRRAKFSPYRKGMGPTFTVVLWDTGRSDNRGQSVLGYKLSSSKDGEIFKGEDFAGSPMHAIDSDKTICSLMSFLTLKPGDTDREYFANYTQKQMRFAEEFAESLQMAVIDRYGEC